ncbi:MAG TPA: EutN/CcmL family microcompartment protein [Kiritimatiellia bacterium]|nr:EutN/CcmL family microcompartment protein [Kiritimatiellia bacterium]HNR93870.1 EutN/CcmL family microcompartment protein [Kiritimatiellia bacterium]HNS80457.1 EutN/CcmL family microcompartment protein [Kiritimatiellia bacterium]HPA77282.1 EutN/CcmL family microcompartment protein [Kiritimatiellia bacterium]HQQ03230.1 EutN/CcmL family microcompartment protein [Kiritimatiellia bacterium]
MIAGRVTGHIFSTINHPFYDGKRMLVVEKIDENGKALNDYVIAVDTVDAGPGDKVLIVDEGNGARQILQSSDGPVRSVIVGIIDQITVD